MNAEQQVRGVLLGAARAAAPQWPPGLLERVEGALERADPPGLDSWATRAEWGAATAEELRRVPQNAGERALLAKLQAVADGAAGAFAEEQAGLSGMVRAQGEAVAEAGQETLETLDDLIRSPKTWAVLGLLILGGGYLYQRRRR